MSSWTKLRHYAGLLEADMDRARLEDAGIPVLVQGPVTGVFGPGFAGPTPQGVTLLVPGELREEARELLDLDDVDGNRPPGED